MSDYKKIPTSKAMFRAFCSEHKELKVCSSYSAPDGDYFGNPNQCRMLTEYGFDGCDYPIIGAETKWDRNPEKPYERENEKHTYWLCVAVDCDK